MPTPEEDLAAIPSMTPKELYQAERRAGLHSIEALRKLEQKIEVLRREGIARGGMHCCGTTGKWHNAWCWTGQTKPEES